jgi:hypothetical protein
LAECNREAKHQLQLQWKRMGITLPQQVIDYHVPYCREVKSETISTMDDQVLNDIWNAINELSEQIAPWHGIYHQKYFGDLSFLFSALSLGFNKALKLKYTVVKNIIHFKNENIFEQVINNITDFEI